MRKLTRFINSLFSKLPSHRSWIFWFLLALLFKGSFFLYKTSIEENPFVNKNNKITFADEGGDTHSYIEPIDNYIKTGVYSSEGAGDYRMPGYGVPYYLLRCVLDETGALNALVLLQLLLSAVSVYTLALLAMNIFKKQVFFYATFFMYAISTYVSLYDHVLLTESFCTSALIIGAYMMLTEIKTYRKILFSGLMLTWCIFLKPVMAPLLILFALYLLICTIFSQGVLKSLITVFVFLIPFIIIDGAWVIRNYKLYNRVIPLAKSFYYPTTENSYIGSLYSFMNAYGGSLVSWEPGADITFFLPAPAHLKKKIDVIPPDYIYTSKFNYDSLVVVKNLIKEISNPEINPALKKIYDDEIKNRLNTYTLSIKEEKPFLFHISSRIKPLKAFFKHSGTYNLFFKSAGELNLLQLLFKIFSAVLFVAVLVFGFLGSAKLFIMGFKNIDYLLFSSIAFYVALVFPLLLKLDEYRYFVPGYPFFLVAALFFISICFQFLDRKFTKQR